MSPGVQRIETARLHEPVGASWSNALRIGPQVLLSGITAHPQAVHAAQNGEALDAHAQTLLVLDKILVLVEAAGGHRGNIHRLRIYLTDIADKDQVGRARQAFFAGQALFPTSTLVEVGALVCPQLRVEIEAEARLDIDLCSPQRGE